MSEDKFTTRDEWIARIAYQIAEMFDDGTIDYELCEACFVTLNTLTDEIEVGRN
jgi:hypothetical protein